MNCVNLKHVFIKRTKNVETKLELDINISLKRYSLSSETENNFLVLR
jgi:hypothetical protein